MLTNSFLRLASLSALVLGATSVAGRGISSSLTARQITSDTCANVDAPVTSTNNPSLSATVDACICLSSVQSFVEGDPDLQALVNADGLDAIVADVQALINDDQDAQTCTYPANSVPACTADDVCAFTCTNGYTASPANAPTECVCEAPNTVCNGVCSSQACPSGTASNGRRSYYGSPLRKRAMCAKGHTACGAYERRGALSDPWECVNTANDLESCGGCITPLDARSPKGVDCTSLPGVVDVSCVTGSCVVRRCAEGYSVNANNSSCISSQARMVVQY